MTRRRRLIRNARRWTLALIVVGVLVRLWAVFPAAPVRLAAGDEHFYWERSRAILATGDPDSAWQPPLYPYVLATAGCAGADSLAAARGLNAAFYLLTAAGLVVLASRWSRAVFPTAVLALHPVFVGFAGLLLSETLFAAALVWAFALQQRGGPWALAGSGFLWGLAALTREIAIPFFALSLLIHSRRLPGRLSRARGAAILLATFALTVTPWLVRNQQALGVPVFTTSRGFNLWAGNEAEVSPAYAWHSHKLGVHYRHYLEFSDSELERDAVAMRRALRFIRDEQPRWIIRKTWEGISHLLEPYNYVMRQLRQAGYGRLSPLERGAVASITLLGELAVIGWGVWTLLSLRRSPRRFLVVAMLAAGVAVHVVTLSDSRHRLGLELLFFLTAGCRFQPFAARRVRLALLLVAALVVIGLLSPGRSQLLEFFEWPVFTRHGPVPSDVRSPQG
jgi:hypothetical protein